MTEPANLCPLCDRAAAMRSGPHSDYRHYECEHCLEFVITPVAEKIIRAAAPFVREAFSAKARKSSDSHIYSIRRANREELEREPSMQLSGRLVPR